MNDTAQLNLTVTWNRSEKSPARIKGYFPVLSTGPGLIINAKGIASGPKAAPRTAHNTGLPPRDLAIW
ncbi:MAG: hypothetical protein AB2764_04655 [Candidatus Thiodiazotropha endolucinida]